eukprot:528643-Amphidinium_carterae.1
MMISLVSSCSSKSWGAVAAFLASAHLHADVIYQHCSSISECSGVFASKNLIWVIRAAPAASALTSLGCNRPDRAQWLQYLQSILKSLSCISCTRIC